MFYLKYNKLCTVLSLTQTHPKYLYLIVSAIRCHLVLLAACSMVANILKDNKRIVYIKGFVNVKHARINVSANQIVRLHAEEAPTT